LEDLRREYERIKAFISRLEEEHAQGRIEKEVYRKLLEEYKKRLSEVEESLAKAGKTENKVKERKEGGDEMILFFIILFYILFLIIIFSLS
jgi:regulator of replication initiation timing